jgi:hypothetical protein
MMVVLVMEMKEPVVEADGRDSVGVRLEEK